MRALSRLFFMGIVGAGVAFAQEPDADVVDQFKKSAATLATRLFHVESCQLSPDTPEEVTRWFLSRRDSLIADIGASPHRWECLSGGTPYFARTSFDPSAPILFCHFECDKLAGKPAEIERLLLRQSVLHLAKTSAERKVAFVDSVVKALTTTLPVCEKSKDDVFSRNYCGGEVLTEADVRAALNITRNTTTKVEPVTVAQFRFATRGRYKLKRGDWTEWAGLRGANGDAGIDAFEVKNTRWFFSSAAPKGAFATQLTNTVGNIVYSYAGDKFLVSLQAKLVPAYSISHQDRKQPTPLTELAVGPLAFPIPPIFKTNLHAIIGTETPVLNLYGAKTSELEGAIRKNCVWLRQLVESTGKDADQNEITLENEMVLYSRSKP